MNVTRKDEEQRVTPANVLTAFRLLAAPVLLYFALAGEHTLFLWLLTASFLSDAADGTVARLSGGATTFGAKFDSLADAVAYTAIAISVVLLWPDLVHSELPAFVTVIASLVLPAVAGLFKYGQLTSYHTRLVKIAVGSVAIGLLLLLLGIAHWPFRAAAVLAAFSGLEQVAVTLLLREPKSDVGGLRTVLRSWQSL